jgi:thiol-disulfide isomerase/thioredoxin
MRRMIAAGPVSNRPPHILFAWLVARLSTLSARFGTVALALLVALSAATAAEEEKPKLGQFIPASPPQPAPELSFTDLDGKPARLADFKGKLLVLNLWATWCGPCLEEMPSLEQLQLNLPDQLVVLAVSEDRGGAKIVQPFLDKLGLKKVKIYLDPKSDVGHAFEVRGLPTSMVIGADGKVLGRVEGAAEWDSVEMYGVLKPLLPKGPGKDMLKHALAR